MRFFAECGFLPELTQDVRQRRVELRRGFEHRVVAHQRGIRTFEICFHGFEHGVELIWWNFGFNVVKRVYRNDPGDATWLSQRCRLQLQILSTTGGAGATPLQSSKLTLHFD